MYSDSHAYATILWSLTAHKYANYVHPKLGVPLGCSTCARIRQRANLVGEGYPVEHIIRVSTSMAISNGEYITIDLINNRDVSFSLTYC